MIQGRIDPPGTAGPHRTAAARAGFWENTILGGSMYAIIKLHSKNLSL